jgi:hypothetical protein
LPKLWRTTTRPFTLLDPLYRVAIWVLAVVGLLGTVVGAAFVRSMAAHPVTWLWVGLATVGIVSSAISCLALRYEHDVRALADENALLQRELVEVRERVADQRLQERLDDVVSRLETLKAPRAPWWRRNR